MRLFLSTMVSSIIYLSRPNVLITPDLCNDIFDVKSELISLSANWKSIGIALRLNPNTLDSIQAGNSSEPTACLTSVVTEWLKRNYNVERFGEPTWQWLVKAVGDPAGGANMALARDIARKHKAQCMYGLACFKIIFTFD